ncbi:MAG: uroporphyrinogen decarboxylase family protein [Gammaproteobacteria bacterium]|nr:uroporphyrinogen decarboxylase family protein [Gammaproteobacteria bacterium]
MSRRSRFVIPQRPCPDIAEAIRLIRRELPFGYSSDRLWRAPFTLASYAIEGKGSRNYVFVKQMMYGDTGAWNELMTRITSAVIDYMNYQIDSGVQAVQLFDSWVGCLSPADYREYVMPHSRRLMESIAGRVPVIHFGTGNPALAPLMAEAGGDVLALDWRTPLMETWNETGVTAVQGNLDPIVLCASRETVIAKATTLLEEVGGRPGHIFNLGHGIIPETPVDNVKALVECVQSFRPAS